MLAHYLALALLLALAHARDIVGRVVWNKVVPGADALAATAQVWIGPRAQDSSFVWHNGSFKLFNVEPGLYILRASPHQYHFNDLTVQVPLDAADDPLVHVYDWRYVIPPLELRGTRLPYPIELVPLAAQQYEEKVQGFQPLQMLMANPLYLIMGGGVILMMLMPKLIGMLDPESLQEMQQNQAQMQKSMQSVQNLDFSGITKMLSEGASQGKDENESSAGKGGSAKPRGLSSSVKSSTAKKRR